MTAVLAHNGPNGNAVSFCENRKPPAFTLASNGGFWSADARPAMIISAKKITETMARSIKAR